MVHGDASRRELESTSHHGFRLILNMKISKIVVIAQLILIVVLVAVIFGMFGPQDSNDFSLNYIDENKFDRGEYVRKVDSGDVDAAVTLAHYYATKGISEAALFWFQKAVSLGYKGISKEGLEACERSIFDSEK